MNKSYLRWLWRQNRSGVIFLSLIYLVLIFAPFFGHRIDTQMLSNWLRQSYLTAGYISLLLAVFAPMLLFSYVHRKRSVDLYFALPVSRKDQLICGIAYSWILSAGLFVLGTFVVTIVENGAVMLGEWALMQSWAIAAYLVVILFTLWTYLVANNLFDGVVMAAAYAFLPVAVQILVSCFDNIMLPASGDHLNSLAASIATYLSPLAMTIVNLTALMPGSQEPYTLLEAVNAGFRSGYIVSMILFAIFAIFGLKKQFIDRKSERAEQISDDFAAYPFIIHIYALIVLLILGIYSAGMQIIDTDTVIGYVMLFAIYVIALSVYRRTVKINLKYVGLFVVALVLTFALCRVGWKTRGFGQADSYKLDTQDELTYGYYAQVDSDNLGKFSEDDDRPDYVTVEFDLAIPANEANPNNPTVSIMESYRKKLIDAFYNSRESEGSAIPGQLSVYNTKQSDPGKQFNVYNYALGSDGLLSEEDLLEINKITPVWVVNYADYSNDQYYVSSKTVGEVRVDEFIHNRDTQK